ncbi:MAG: hypothetical protein JXP34_13285 [Planctomycetes bacterium]|nr:hypothetical protein [Planctomycetota bacterium]
MMEYLLVLVLSGAAGPAFPENIAKGKPYALSPAPNYTHCTDPGDATQLTDGVYSEGYFWTQKTTVGWRSAAFARIAIDLGRIEPIRGVSVNTAAGVAGVTWPAAIFVFASDDGKRFRPAGDLVALGASRGLPPAGGYAVHRYVADALRTRGRYVTVVIQSSGPYTFADEIEIARGDTDWLDEAMDEGTIADIRGFVRANRAAAAMRRRLLADLERVRAIAGADADLDRIAQEIPKAAPGGPDFRAILPVNDLHARIFRVHARALRAGGLRGLVAWTASPWDWMDPFETPRGSSTPAIRIFGLVGEVRAGAVRMMWAGEEDAEVSIRFEGLPGAPIPPYLEVRRTVWTDTREGVPVAAALAEAERTGDAFRVRLPSGLASEVWLRCHLGRKGLAAGRYAGAIILDPGIGDRIRVPLEIEAFPLPLGGPREALLVGGWDYTDGDARYGVTPENRLAFIEHLKSRGVNAPWATSAVLPAGRYDGAGKLVETPDTARLDEWLERWKGARRYCVFAAVGGGFAGSRIGDALFDKKVDAWISFWMDHLKGKGIEAEKLVLLLVDEPHERAQEETTVAWAKAIHAARPKVTLFVDPTRRDPREALPAFYEACDIYCPNRPMLLAQGEPFERFYRELRAGGKRLCLYSCSGPTRLLDPYAYYRLQAWDAYRLGAEGSFFWAFGDTGRGSSWNEYATEGTSYAPLFLDARTVTPGKHMEAIHESAQDHGCLMLLRSTVQALRGKPGGPADSLAKAERLLREAPERVRDAPGAKALEWRAEKDRSVADAVRREILETLGELR